MVRSNTKILMRLLALAFSLGLVAVFSHSAEAAQSPQEAAMPLVRNGQAVATIVIPNRATKDEISAAVAMLFKVEVTGVQVMNVKGKVKKNRYGMARQKDWKKAYVSIKSGQEIDLATA